MSDWVKIREKIIEVFANAPRPNLDTVSIIGCCERHEHDFDWYRRHTWQEFENAIETRGFDIATYRLDNFKKHYLPHFEIEQRLAVSEVLEWYQHWYLAQKGYDYDEPDDIEEDSGKISETIALVWQSES